MCFCRTPRSRTGSTEAFPPRPPTSSLVPGFLLEAAAAVLSAEGLPPSVCLLLAPLHPPPSQQQYVGSAAQAEAGLLARTLPGICECPAKSAGPAGKCWRIKLQVVTLQHLGKAQALPQMCAALVDGGGKEGRDCS